MKNNQNSEQRYLKINGEEFAVTEEVYLAYMRPVWAEAKIQEREGRCRDENGNRCMKDCRFCDKTRQGRPLSLEQFSEDGFDVVDSIDTAGFVENQLLYDALHTALSQLSPENRRIAELFSIGLSERVIAAKVGLSQKGVNSRKQKIFSQLREYLKDFR